MEALQWIKRISQWVWGPWMLVLLVGTGVFLTIRLKAYPCIKAEAPKRFAP